MITRYTIVHLLENGQRFSARHLQVSFALRSRTNKDKSTLTIRAQSCTGEVFELIPHGEFNGDFPTFFVSDNVHWMNLSSGAVEFRALNRPWESSVTNWKLYFSSTGVSIMVCGPLATARHLVDIHSETFNGIFQRLSSLESSKFVTVTYSSIADDVSVDLPRFRLSFTLDSDGDLRSQNMPDMVVDGNQSSGTMIGLQTQLILRAKETIASKLPRSRCAIVPHGDVVYTRTSNQHHVIVRIELPDKQRQIVWHEYRIDSDLGYLANNVNLTSRLFKIYLHALCSYPLPDPLTQQTGAEQALQELRSAASFSFQRLAESDAHLLNLIRSLTPSRTFYPSHRRVMRTIAWSPHLPASSQLVAYEEAGQNILRYGQSLENLFAESESGSYAELDSAQRVQSDPLLLDHGIRRESVYGLIDDPPLPADAVYRSRDVPERSEADFAPATFSHLVFSWPDALRRGFKPPELLGLLQAWDDVAGRGIDVSLAFSREWLNPRLSNRWISVYDHLRVSGTSPSTKFQLIFAFSALAYGSPHHRHIIPILLAFACLPEFRQCVPPSYPSYHLSDGFQLTWGEVRSLIASRSYNMEERPDNILLDRRLYESPSDYHDRRFNAHEKERRSRTDRATDALMAQWPSPTPHSPFNFEDADWFQEIEIMSDVRRLFGSCFRNIALRDHVERVETILCAHASSSPQPVPGFSPMHRPSLAPHVNSHVLWVDLLMRPIEPNLHNSTTVTLKPTSEDFDYSAPADTHELANLLIEFRTDPESKLRRLYGDRLDRSRLDLEGHRLRGAPKRRYVLEELVTYQEQCQAHLRSVSSHIILALSPTNHAEHLLSSACLWPRLGHRNLLRLLATTSDVQVSIGSDWRRVLFNFAHAIMEYQRAQRLTEHVFRGEMESFFKELENTCMTEEQNAEHSPDWLLIQVRRF